MFQKLTVFGLVGLLTILPHFPAAGETRGASGSKKSSATQKASSSQAKKVRRGQSTKTKPSSTPKQQTQARAPELTTVSVESLPALAAQVIQGLERVSTWGIMVVDVTSGQPLVEHRAHDSFIPASNRKLFTGALALDQLGADFTYRTYLYHTGQIEPDGTLRGNLIIRPQGDPTFSNRLVREAQVPTDWIFRDWVEKVRAANIRSVAGELIVDCSEWDLNDLRPKGWSQRILQDTYAPRTSPLTLNENLLQMIAKPGSPGSPAIIEFAPPAEGYPILNRTVTGGKRSISVRLTPDERVEVTGSIPTDSKPIPLPEIPCDNPTLYAAAVFRSHLHRAGIPVNGNLRVETRKGALERPTTSNVLAVYISPPMAEIVRTMMKHSNNHFAEQIYVSISAVKRGRGGYSQTRVLEQDFLRRCGLPVSELRAEDGSGLSRLNNVSPASVCSLLVAMHRHPAAKEFFDSLAVGGLDGTLRGRMRNETTLARVHAKTGYIANVVCLSGYADTKSGRRFAFSFLVNNVKTSPDSIKNAQDRLCELLCRVE
ncbi:D-alanyl-D-alanine carboxypeptidase [Candidatus Sumerlaea chitinivorans]|uniref:D-alanyl-D-alanine carboxypeptidase n=1 Tax=Sumerlaea chitinivorans TaxID=2250252 RepID=A0A2Z4Y1Y0_SUMC1|nr:D-alanyl-D-alanine carboxypeptidase [Candidatus Sumerlaea chitinivorans]